MLILALFITSKNEKQLKSKWLKILRYTRTVEYYATITRNDL